MSTELKSILSCNQSETHKHSFGALTMYIEWICIHAMNIQESVLGVCV